MVEKKKFDRAGIWLGIGGCKRLCRRGRGAWPGYTVFPARVD